MSGILVIGVGNPYRGDDGVGPAVVDLLRDRQIPDVMLECSLGDTAELIDLWAGAELAVLVDAVRAEPAPDVRPGDTVALHWDWVCDVLDARQAAALRHYTQSQLRVANRALRRPVADLVLG